MQEVWSMSPFERLRGAHLTNHPVLEDLIFSTLSLLVLVVAAMAIMAGQNARLVAEATAAGPPAKQVAIYGTLVDQNGQPIQGATVTVSYAKNNKLATGTTNANGEFNIRFNAETSPYTITVVTPQGQSASTTLDMSGGMTWGLRMTMIPSSNWIFVPLPGY
ncbi:MAG: carboxypeptidase regulatory-like domain-containing protein [Actinobacteria bacterium]|nr:MAG: carboxypeptidase regulatory-like domain-containing protein [Actinomycetota bacterium]